MDHMDRYLEWRAVTGASERTIVSLRKLLRLFVEWCAVRGLRHPAEFTRPVLEAYQRNLYLTRKQNGEPLSVRSQLHRLRALMGWCRWLSRERVIEHNASADLVLPRESKTLPKLVPSVTQIARLMAQPDLMGITGTRDRAILEVLYSTGMRAMELCGLGLGDVDLEQSTVWVRQGKGRRDRFIPLGARAGDWIRRYLSEVRPQLVVTQQEWALFLTDYGEPYLPGRLGSLVRRYLRQAGLMSGASHVLRHACATHMLENGADIRYIQALLGHAQLSTTQIYTQVAIGKLKAIHAATHPSRAGEVIGTSALGEDAAPLLAALEAEAREEADGGAAGHL
ncbi:recombinase XerD [Burkholderia stagnalis]|nr:recombinase XerD [Burkholderia stagnalis]